MYKGCKELAVILRDLAAVLTTAASDIESYGENAHSNQGVSKMLRAAEVAQRAHSHLMDERWSTARTLIVRARNYVAEADKVA